LLAMAIGLSLGALTPWLIGSALSTLLPVADAIPGLYWSELFQALVYGLLIALAFALWPLGRAREIAASALFRDHVASRPVRPRRFYLVALAVIVITLTGLAILL